MAQKILDALEEPIYCGGVTRMVTPSIGIAICHGGSESANELISRADAAMHIAKKNGRNQYLFAPGFAQTALVDTADKAATYNFFSSSRHASWGRKNWLPTDYP